MSDKFVEIPGVGKLVLTGLILSGGYVFGFFQVRDSEKHCPQALKDVLKKVTGYERKKKRIVRCYSEDADIDSEMKFLADKISLEFLDAILDLSMFSVVQSSKPAPQQIMPPEYWNSSVFTPFTEVTVENLWKNFKLGKFSQDYSGPGPNDYVKALQRKMEVSEKIKNGDFFIVFKGSIDTENFTLL